MTEILGKVNKKNPSMRDIFRRFHPSMRDFVPSRRTDTRGRASHPSPNLRSGWQIDCVPRENANGLDTYLTPSPESSKGWERLTEAHWSWFESEGNNLVSHSRQMKRNFSSPKAQVPSQGLSGTRLGKLELLWRKGLYGWSGGVFSSFNKHFGIK